MIIKDKHLDKMVGVADKDCWLRPCYWPRPDPGAFAAGAGYKVRAHNANCEYICGTREKNGCPAEHCGDSGE